MRKMSKKRTQEFQKFFTDEKYKILNSTSSNFNIDIDGDDIDKVQGTILEVMSDHLSQREQFKLNNIESAIKRLNNGTFGECAECEKQIPIARLTARPESTTCIECAEELENMCKDFML